jgi:hypothetical protein
MVVVGFLRAFEMLLKLGDFAGLRTFLLEEIAGLS